MWFSAIDSSSCLAVGECIESQRLGLEASNITGNKSFLDAKNAIGFSWLFNSGRIVCLGGALSMIDCVLTAVGKDGCALFNDLKTVVIGTADIAWDILTEVDSEVSKEFEVTLVVATSAFADKSAGCLMSLSLCGKQRS